MAPIAFAKTRIQAINHMYCFLFHNQNLLLCSLSSTLDVEQLTNSSEMFYSIESDCIAFLSCVLYYIVRSKSFLLNYANMPQNKTLTAGLARLGLTSVSLLCYLAPLIRICCVRFPTFLYVKKIVYK